MEDDRRNMTSIHLTVRLCVVTTQMRATWRSSREHVAKAVRRRIIRFVLFCLMHLTGND